MNRSSRQDRSLEESSGVDITHLSVPDCTVPSDIHQVSPILEIILAKYSVVCRLLAACEAAKAYPLSRNRETCGILWRDVDEVSSSPSL
jgi:hypothetical protein